MCNDDAAPSIGADASFFDDLAGLGHFRFYVGSKLLGRKVKSEIVLWSKIIKDAGLQQD